MSSVQYETSHLVNVRRNVTSILIGDSSEQEHEQRKNHLNSTKTTLTIRTPPPHYIPPHDRRPPASPQSERGKKKKPTKQKDTGVFATVSSPFTFPMLSRSQEADENLAATHNDGAVPRCRPLTLSAARVIKERGEGEKRRNNTGTSSAKGTTRRPDERLVSVSTRHEGPFPTSPNRKAKFQIVR